MTHLLERLSDILGLGLPPFGMATVIVLLLYAIQAEIRFGAKARSHRSGERDRGSTILLSVASLVPILGFAIIMKARSGGALLGLSTGLPAWLLWPSSPHSIALMGWSGVVLGLLGLLLRLWAVLTLRERYTRTLLVHEAHSIERRGPYRVVRHPGYVGSLLTLNGIGLASSSLAILLLSIATTVAAYAYRVRVEDRMLIDVFGEQYQSYRRQVAGLIPFVL